MVKQHLNLIKDLRKKKKLKQQDIADKIGVSRSSYISFEQGKKELSFSQIMKLTELLGINIEDLEGGNLPDIEKYKEMILAYIRRAASADGKIPKTKLAKMLYLADFGMYYEQMKSMSGASYRCRQYGPVPDLYFRALDELEESGQIQIDHKNDMLLISETDSSKINNLKLLSREERELIEKIAKKWKSKRTREIVGFTHDQLPFKICSDNEVIPYELITQEDPDHVY